MFSLLKQQKIRNAPDLESILSGSGFAASQSEAVIKISEESFRYAYALVLCI